MKASYLDIKEKVKETPRWYDENGVPRYRKFHPDHLPDIYAKESILLEIACQNCGKRFLVGMSYNESRARLRGDENPQSFSERIRKRNFGWIHYGDPPIHECVGDTMNAYDLRIMEFWKRNWKYAPEWKRIKKYEIKFGEKRK